MSAAAFAIASGTRPSGTRGATGGWVFPVILLATLIQNTFDLTNLLAGGGLDLTSYEGPVWIKIGKDLVYGLLLLAVAVQAWRLRRSPVTDLSFALLLLLASLAVVSFLVNGPLVAVIGVRWALPFVLFLLMGDWATRIEPRKAAAWLVAGMAICLAAQGYELVAMPPVFGEVLPGVPARVPGIFIAPNSAAFFACASAAAVRAYVPGSRRLGLGVALAALVTSGLAQSGTGIIVAAILVLEVAARDRPTLFWGAAAAGVVVLFLFLDRITGRDEYVAVSGGGRVEVFIAIVRHSFLSLDRFGIFTNAANLQAMGFREWTAADSLVASWIGNLGILALPAAALAGAFVLRRMPGLDWKRATPCLVVLGLFAMTTIVFEAFPMNVHLALGLWAAAAPGAEPEAVPPAHGLEATRA